MDIYKPIFGSMNVFMAALYSGQASTCVALNSITAVSHYAAFGMLLVLQQPDECSGFRRGMLPQNSLLRVLRWRCFGTVW